MLALAPRPPPVLRRSPGRSLSPWPPGAVRALHPTPRTSGPRARPRPREYAPPRARTPLRPKRPASNPSERPTTSLPSPPLQDAGARLSRPYHHPPRPSGRAGARLPRLQPVLLPLRATGAPPAFQVCRHLYGSQLPSLPRAQGEGARADRKRRAGPAGRVGPVGKV
ncbi:unnamed protein product, partial [Rangifer tarandus platyrhynchus]